MSLSREAREQIAKLIEETSQTTLKLIKAQRQEYIRLFLRLFEQLQKLDSEFRPYAFALLSRSVLSDEDVESAEAVMAAELASSPSAGAYWQALEELKRLAKEVDREDDSAK